MSLGGQRRQESGEGWTTLSSIAMAISGNSFRSGSITWSRSEEGSGLTAT